MHFNTYSASAQSCQDFTRDSNSSIYTAHICSSIIWTHPWWYFAGGLIFIHMYVCIRIYLYVCIRIYFSICWICSFSWIYRPLLCICRARLCIVGLFCVFVGLFCGYVGLFCGYVGSSVDTQAPFVHTYNDVLQVFWSTYWAISIFVWVSASK